MAMRLHDRGISVLCRVLTFASCLLLSVPSALGAQVVSGTVVRPDSTTLAAGVLVEARAQRAVAPQRTLTSARGAFRFTFAPGDTVQIRVLRPGFRPVVRAGIPVEAGRATDLRIVLVDTPVHLATVNVTGSRVCGERADAAAWTLWEQARTVLETTALTERDTALTVRTLEYQGQATPRGATIVKDSSIMWVPVDPPFPRAHYDSLFTLGFIRRNSDTVTTYYAPNAHVLLDERFVLTHCFRVAERDSTPTGLIGVRFEPMRRPRYGYTDIVGTFWLDSASYHLRAIEFGYANPPPRHQVIGTGGFVLFTRLGTGHWIMSEWSIRMASLVVFREAWGRLRKEDGTYWMRRDGVTPHEGARVTSDHLLWSRNQMVVSVHRGDQLLFHEPAGDSLSTRLIPFTPGDPRLPCAPGRTFNCKTRP